MGNSPEIELKKMSQELSVFGGSEKEFISIYKKSKQEPFDFCFLNIQDLTARRNFEEKELWNTSMKGKGNESETSDSEEESGSSTIEEETDSE